MFIVGFWGLWAIYFWLYILFSILLPLRVFLNIFINPLRIPCNVFWSYFIPCFSPVTLRSTPPLHPFPSSCHHLKVLVLLFEKFIHAYNMLWPRLSLWFCPFPSLPFPSLPLFPSNFILAEKQLAVGGCWEDVFLKDVTLERLPNSW